MVVRICTFPEWRNLCYVVCNLTFRGVAQPGSALALGARGPRFESARPDQDLPLVFTGLAFPLLDDFPPNWEHSGTKPLRFFQGLHVWCRPGRACRAAW